MPRRTRSSICSAATSAATFARYRLDESDAPLLATRQPPAWVYLHGIMSGLSSSVIRAQRKESILAK